MCSCFMSAFVLKSIICAHFYKSLLLAMYYFMFFISDLQVEKAHDADLHCVDWNPHDDNLILTGYAVISSAILLILSGFDCASLSIATNGEITKHVNFIYLGIIFSTGRQIILSACLIAVISLLMELGLLFINLRATKLLFSVFRF